MTIEYLQKIIDNPKTSREEYMFAWNILQERLNQNYMVQNKIN